MIGKPIIEMCFDEDALRRAPGRNLNSQEGELPVAPSGLQAGPQIPFIAPYPRRRWGLKSIHRFNKLSSHQAQPSRRQNTNCD